MGVYDSKPFWKPENIPIDQRGPSAPWALTKRRAGIHRRRWLRRSLADWCEKGKRPDQRLWRWLRQKVFQRDRWMCQYCHKYGDKVQLQVDHVVPVYLGGNNRLRNLITACRDCNTKKKHKLLSKSQIKAIDRGIMERFHALKDEEEYLERLFRDKMAADD